MSGPPADRGDGAREAGEADDEFARGYAEGYGEGLREALRELLQHIGRGHTAQEIKILSEVRIARVPEDVEIKRRSLLRSPRRPAWGALLRPPRPASPWTPPAPALLPVPTVGPGQSILVREEAPKRALEIVERNAASFPRLVVVTFHPPTGGPSALSAAEVVRVGRAASEPGSAGLDPGRIGGRVRESVRAPGGALVYVDAIEVLITEFGLETTLKLLTFLAEEAAEARSALVATLDPRALEPRDLSRLQRAFLISL